MKNKIIAILKSIDWKNISAATYTRYILMIIAIINLILTGVGANPIKASDADRAGHDPPPLLHGLRQRRGFGPNRPYRSRPRHRLHASGRPDRASPQRGLFPPARHSGTDTRKRAKPDARHLLGTIHSQHARRRKRHRPDGLRHGQLPHGTFAELLRPAPRRDRPQREKAGNGRRRFRRNFARYGLRPEEYNLHDRRRLPHPEKGDRHSRLRPRIRTTLFRFARNGPFRTVRPHRLRLRPDVRYGGINPAGSVPHPARPNCPSLPKNYSQDDERNNNRLSGRQPALPPGTSRRSGAYR